jgi:hypothetical protein
MCQCVIDLLAGSPSVGGRATKSGHTASSHYANSDVGPLLFPADKLILEHQKEVRMYPDFSRGAGESWGHFAKRMCVEGHTFFDACKLCTQIAQAMNCVFVWICSVWAFGCSERRSLTHPNVAACRAHLCWRHRASHDDNTCKCALFSEKSHAWYVAWTSSPATMSCSSAKTIMCCCAAETLHLVCCAALLLKASGAAALAQRLLAAANGGCPVLFNSSAMSYIVPV